MSPGRIRYSVVVPVFCEAESLVELTDRVAVAFRSMGHVNGFEIVFVDDGSTDDSPAIIRRLSAERPYVRAVTLRRNCGKSMAYMAGFGVVRGDCVITLDGDLQDNPEDIPALVAKLEEGFDVVGGWRTNRRDSFVRKLGSRIFNAATARFTGLYIHDFNCGLKAYRRVVVDALCIHGQYHRYTPLLAHLLGYRVAEVPVTNSERKYGQSRYRAFRFHGFFDLLSILFIHRYGTSPLHFFGVISALFVVPSFSLLSYWLVRHALYLAGFGEEYMLFPRPLLSLALMVLFLGFSIFLVGFVCDFVLHHQIRSNIKTLVALHVDGVTENGERAPSPALAMSDWPTAPSAHETPAQDVPGRLVSTRRA